jgi:hypothetical protein
VARKDGALYQTPVGYVEQPEPAEQLTEGDLGLKTLNGESVAAPEKSLSI